MSAIANHLNAAINIVQTAHSKINTNKTIMATQPNATNIQNTKPSPANSLRTQNETLLAKKLELEQSLNQLQNHPVIGGSINTQIDSINKQLKAQILAATAPILILPSEEVNLPADPVTYIQNSELKEDKSFRGDPILNSNKPNADKSTFNPAELVHLGDNHYITPGIGDAITKIGSEDAPIFYQTDINGDEPKVTYHVFYPYNDGPLSQNHEGDWERITVYLNPNDLTPESVTYSAHGGGTTVPYYEDKVNGLPGVADPQTGQPVVFVANGSHANYPSAGEFPTNAPGLNDNTVTDTNNDNIINEEDGAVTVNTEDNLKPVEEEDWYPEEGNEGIKWGEQGAPGFADVVGTDGPTGPSTEKAHQEKQEEH